ncbi:pimeloyl-ACP methyl ester carboxylesterase [Leucobacter exalbidus]|uniref:Pimeloyl-ACP methyl ester carboxylesterase n=1 Tax=Leucobacter exalbidus TaxID=662960 RepID=A0A940PTC7_9MICO|nr:alpha/beta fold hydrolase [Leucobacter exalbidus]MBP1324876.1 pimeloyl-ACP methyl ester carboxylesterase [Leucobacter exalbidus]
MQKHSSALTSFVLVPGYWLGGWAWDAVASELRCLGHHVTTVTLPGLDPLDRQRTTRTLDDQAAALLTAVNAADAHGTEVTLVVHSGAGAPASLLLDRHPAAVARIIYVDSGPVADGSAFDGSLDPELHEVALPPFDELAASLDGLSEADLETFRQRAVPQPAGIMRESVSLHNPLRRHVPSTIIACSFPAQVLEQMTREGHPMMAETATLTRLNYVDLPTGHWPMWSRPVDLAATLAKTAARAEGAEGATAAGA